MGTATLDELLPPSPAHIPPGERCTCNGYLNNGKSRFWGNYLWSRPWFMEETSVRSTPQMTLCGHSNSQVTGFPRALSDLITDRQTEALTKYFETSAEDDLRDILHGTIPVSKERYENAIATVENVLDEAARQFLLEQGVTCDRFRAARYEVEEGKRLYSIPSTESGDGKSRLFKAVDKQNPAVTGAVMLNLGRRTEKEWATCLHNLNNVVVHILNRYAESKPVEISREEWDDHLIRAMGSIADEMAKQMASMKEQTIASVPPLDA